MLKAALFVTWMIIANSVVVIVLGLALVRFFFSNRLAEANSIGAFRQGNPLNTETSEVVDETTGHKIVTKSLRVTGRKKVFLPLVISLGGYVALYYLKSLLLPWVF